MSSVFFLLHPQCVARSLDRGDLVRLGEENQLNSAGVRSSRKVPAMLLGAGEGGLLWSDNGHFCWQRGSRPKIEAFSRIEALSIDKIQMVPGLIRWAV